MMTQKIDFELEKFTLFRVTVDFGGLQNQYNEPEVILMLLDIVQPDNNIVHIHLMDSAY